MHISTDDAFLVSMTTVTTKDETNHSFCTTWNSHYLDKGTMAAFC